MISINQEPIKINTIEEADRALASLAECQTELALLDTSLSESVALAKARAAQDAAPVLAKAQELEAALRVYALENKKMICNGKRKSLELTCGKIGFSASTSLSAADWAEVAAKLAESNNVEVLKTYDPEVDKTALKKWSDEMLAELGVIRETSDDFYAKPSKAQVAQYETGKR